MEHICQDLLNTERATYKQYLQYCLNYLASPKETRNKSQPFVIWKQQRDTQNGRYQSAGVHIKRTPNNSLRNGILWFRLL